MIINANLGTNDKSNIIAGNTLNANIGTLNNIEGVGERRIVESGTVTSYWRSYRDGTDRVGSSPTAYNPANPLQTISVAAKKSKDITNSPFTPNRSNVGF